RLGPGGSTCRQRRDEVGENGGTNGDDNQRERGYVYGLSDAEVAREALPDPAPDDDSEWHTDHERNHHDGGGLAGHRRSHLAARETEGLEDRDIAAAPAHRRHQQVREHTDAEDSKKRSKQEWCRAYCVVALDAGRSLRAGDAG